MVWWIIIEFIGGCILLGWGADRFINGSTTIAKRLGMSPLLIGVVLIGFGTTFPEIVVAIIAAVHAKPDIAIGNAIGSNITNIGLVMGISALIMPVTLRSQLLRREFPFLFIISVLVGLLIWDGMLTRYDGFILLILLGIYLALLFHFVPQDQAMQVEIKQEMREVVDTPINARQFNIGIAWWLLGLVLLFISSELIVNAATTIAKWLHVSDLVIGLTIVAVGTSLPELAATIIASWRKQYDVAIGNIIGSNIFNILAVLAMPALIAPSRLTRPLLLRDFPYMLGMTVLIWLLSLLPPKRRQLGRGAGVILLVSYLGYVLLVVLPSHHLA